MENIKQVELEILIAIRNNETIPADEFYKLFDHRWPEYRKSMGSLYDGGLFIISRQYNKPGANKFELTPDGKLRVTELLSERSEDIHIKLSEGKKVRSSETSAWRSSLSGIIDFVSAFSLRFKRQVH
jgi:hypothetical protein